MTKPKTGKERQAAYVSKGRAIACVIRDERAQAALAALERKHGGVTAAVTAALHAATARDWRASA